MAISKVIRPVSDVKVGIKGEGSFGNGLADDTAFRQLPIVQVQKPTFNTFRESRLLSGRGLVKHKDDTIVNNRGGTVTMPFEFIATPKLLAQHLAACLQEHSESGTYKHLYEVGGQGSETGQIGGSVSNNIPHTFNIAYYPHASAGTRIVGAMVSDMTINLDYGTNGGLMTVSGNYFSGFSNPVAGGTKLETDFNGSWVAPETTGYYNICDMSTKTLGVDDASANDLVLKSLSLNLANGVNRVGHNSNGDAEMYALPEYAISGSMTIKMDDNFDYTAGTNVIQDFLDGDTMKLKINIGDGTLDAVGEANIVANIQYTGDPAQDISENGIFHNLSFECVDAGTGDENEAFQIELFNGESQSAW
tara:strand:+ start:1767 stop:2852 length:1086 start_codon:yes stop_codon:yes gene_type:complete